MAAEVSLVELSHVEPLEVAEALLLLLQYLLQAATRQASTAPR